jgi:glycyl-tRNA synthetase alpha subunit
MMANAGRNMCVCIYFVILNCSHLMKLLLAYLSSSVTDRDAFYYEISLFITAFQNHLMTNHKMDIFTLSFEKSSRMQLWCNLS